MNISTEQYLSIINESLNKYIEQTEENETNCLLESMRYSINAGGKRIRPMLLLEFCRICGGDIYKAVPFACAVEMIHTYSLIHDDLPCMDNSSTRRGKPSNHVVYGENIALLAGDALLTLAFEIMFREESVKAIGECKVIEISRLLSDKIGFKGMIAGQVLDLKNEGKEIEIEKLKVMDERKTGDLIVSAVKIGCIIAGADEKKIKAAETFASSIGLAFQITDDILDVISNEKDFGKPVGIDDVNKKSTYVSMLGIDKSKELVMSLTNTAIESLNSFEQDTEFLRDLATLLSNRKN